MKESKRNVRAVSQPAGPLYFFGLIGALVYYIQVADGFWQVVLAFLKAIVWPALVTYDLLKFLAQ
jgi:hypothetical protein